MEWTLASKAEYNALKTLGNSGWDWDSMVPYFKKAQSRIAQPDNSIFPGSGSGSGPTIGSSGPVKVSCPEESVIRLTIITRRRGISGTRP